MEAASQWVALNAEHIKVINIETVPSYSNDSNYHQYVTHHSVRVWFWGPPLEHPSQPPPPPPR